MLEFIFGFTILFFIGFAAIVGHFAPTIVSIFWFVFYLVLKCNILRDKTPKKVKKLH